MVSKVFIKDKDDVISINEVAQSLPFPIYASVENEMYDARSFLALFNLIGKKCNIVAPDDADYKVFKKALLRMKLKTL